MSHELLVERDSESRRAASLAIDVHSDGTPLDDPPTGDDSPRAEVSDRRQGLDHDSDRQSARDNDVWTDDVRADADVLDDGILTDDGVGRPAGSAASPVDEDQLDRQLRRAQRWRYPQPWQVARRRPDIHFYVDPVEARSPRRLPRRAIRGWLLSMLAHAAVVACLAFWLRPAESEWPETLVLVTTVGAADTPWETIELVGLEGEVNASPSISSARLLAPGPPAVEELTGGLAPIAIASRPLRTKPAPTGEVRALFGPEATGAVPAGAGRGGAEFFGVKASGSSFVFVVDCSRSMSGVRWHDARRELLASVSRLGPQRTFYVIFFDGQSHRMFQPGTAESVPLPATPDNVDRLRRWSESVRLGNDTSPCRSIQHALKLEPDAIYLLSDGEFTDPTAAYLRQHNKVHRDGVLKMPAVAVHTIGFHSRSGEKLLSRIARENGGQYQFVGGR